MKSICDLRPYQNRISEFIQNNLNCAIWAGMGLGKTVSTLTAIDSLKKTFDVDRTLIIAPLRVARKVWTDELKEWQHLSELRASVMCGTEKERLAAMRTDADIYLINKENVQWLCQQFVIRQNGRLKQIAKWPWDLVVIDESDSFKSQSSERWKWMRRVRRLFPRLIQLTGTPAPHSLKDLWAQIYLLDGGTRLGATESAFKERWMDPPGYGQMQWSMKSNAEQQIHKNLSDIVLSLRSEDYLDLPPIIYNFIRVELSRAARDKYAELEREFIVEIMPDLKVTAVNGGVLSGKLLQMAGGAVYTEEKKWVLIHEEKIKALEEFLDNVHGPVIVAYTFQHEKERIQKMLDVWCKKNKKTSRVLAFKKDEDDWNAGMVDVLLLHPMSGGHGLNLQHSGSENIVWFGMTFNRGHYDQLNARLAGGHRRVGRNIVIHHIVAEDTIDTLDALASLDRKGITQENILKLLADRIAKVMEQ